MISFVSYIFLHPLFLCYYYLVFSLFFCRLSFPLCFLSLFSSSSASFLHLPIILHYSFLHPHLHLLHPHCAVYRYLSMRQAGKGVILEVASQDLKKKIEKILKAEQAARTSVSTYRLTSYFIPRLKIKGAQLFHEYLFSFRM